MNMDWLDSIDYSFLIVYVFLDLFYKKTKKIMKYAIKCQEYYNF